MAGAMLADAPFRIVTAGTHVVEGQPMSRRTRAALASVGLAADGHRSHQLTEDDIEEADLILAMAGEHVAYIRRRHPGAAAKTGTLKRLCRDLPSGYAVPDRAAGRPRIGRCCRSNRGRTSRTRPGERTRSISPVPRNWPSSAPNCGPAQLSGPPVRLDPDRWRRHLRASCGWRSETSEHASHTSSGMTPALIRAPKTMHPRQIAKADSRAAAQASSAGQHPGGGGQPEAEPQDEGRRGEQHPDGLGEPLRRAGHRPRAPRAAGGRPPGWPIGRGGSAGVR